MERVVVILVILVVAMLPSTMAMPLQDDAGSGRDAGDAPSSAVPIEPGEWHGTLVSGADTVDLFVVSADRGDALHLTVIPRAGEHPVVVSLHHQVRAAVEGDAGLGYFGDSAYNGSFSTYAPYTGAWFIRVIATPDGNLPLPGVITYSFSYTISKAVAETRVFEGPAVLELTGLDGTLQVHISMRFPHQEPSAFHLSRLVTVPTEDETWTSSANFSWARSVWGQRLMETTLPAWPDVVQDHSTISFISHMGFQPTHLLRLRAGAVGEGVQIAFSYPLGTEARSATGGPMTMLSVDDLEGGSVRTPIIQGLEGATKDVELREDFDGTFAHWGMPIHLMTPQGTVARDIPERPANGTWRIEGGSGLSRSPQSDVPVLWGASYPQLGIYPGDPPQAGFAFRFLSRQLLPV